MTTGLEHVPGVPDRVAPGAAFLLTMDGALGGVHVENDATLDDAGTAGNTPHTVAVVEAQGVEPEPRDFLS